MSELASSFNTLSIAVESTAFRNLVLDRQCAFMTAEIVRVRDALLGSDALIARAKSDPSGYMLSEIIRKDTSGLELVFKHFFLVVREVGWGDAALRFAGHLPASSWGADQPTVPCFIKSCPCSGQLKRKDVIGFIKSQHKPEWKAYLDLMESQRGSESKESASELRLRLQRSLNKINNDYIKIMEEQLTARNFPHDELPILVGEGKLYSLCALSSRFRRPSPERSVPAIPSSST